MGNVLSANLSGMESFSATHHDAAAKISAASSAHSGEMLSAAAAALGPIGANYLAAYAPAQANNLAAAKLMAHVHTSIGSATVSAKASITAADNA
jgi:hypothetical protein